MKEIPTVSSHGSRKKVDRPRVVIFGGSGLIGTALGRLLQNNGYMVNIVSRNPGKNSGDEHFFIEKIPYGKEAEDAINGSFAVVNLAGAGIGNKRWTKKRKNVILSSRLDTTEYIVKTINSISLKPKVFLQGSAIGYYPFSIHKQIDETSSPGKSFLSKVCLEWEKVSENLSANVRRVIIRTGVVLSSEGGMIPKLLRPLKLYAGAELGKNDQWVSWIHIKDEIESIKYLLENNHLEGIFNLTSPNPEKLNRIIRLLGKLLEKPVFFHIPEKIVRIVFGQMGVETILSGNMVFPEKLLKSGFRFSFPAIKESLEDILKNQ